jgi:Cu/Ag efflux protein CusF
MSTVVNRTALWSIGALVALIPAGCAKETPAPARQPFAIEREQIATGTATVKKIDLKKRLVTLQGEDGRVFTVTAGPEVRNLPQVKVGDVVVIQFYQAVTAEMRSPTAEEKANPREVVEATERAPLGAKPGAAEGRAVRIVGTISAIDMATLQVTVKDLDGAVFTVQARDPNNVAKFKVGDPVVFTYTEAIAIAVEPAPKTKR